MSAAWRGEESSERGSPKRKVWSPNHLDHLQMQHHLGVMGQNVTGRLQHRFSNVPRTQRERMDTLP